MGPDDTVCYCFRVPKRKIVSFLLRERPARASQVSECLSAGTGCGWCVPFIRSLHSSCLASGGPWRGEGMSAAEYEALRARYLRARRSFRRSPPPTGP